MRRSLLCLPLLAAFVASVPRPADACVPPPPRLRYPHAGGTAPPNTRIIGVGFGSGGPDVRYSDGTAITGTYREYVQDLRHSVWTFTPDALLVAGSTVSVSLAFTASVTFTVEATQDLTPPVSGGAPHDFEVHQLHYVETDTGGSTCGDPQAGEQRTGARIRTPAAHDDRAPDDALLYFSSSRWLWAASFNSAGASDCYAPQGVFTPESQPCAVITVEDPSGNSVALPMVCGTVIERTVRLQAQFCYDAPADGGSSSPDTGIADAGEESSADAGSATGEMIEDQGCDCSSSAGGSSILAGLALLLGLWCSRLAIRR